MCVCVCVIPYKPTSTGWCNSCQQPSQQSSISTNTPCYHPTSLPIPITQGHTPTHSHSCPDVNKLLKPHMVMLTHNHTTSLHHTITSSHPHTHSHTPCSLHDAGECPAIHQLHDHPELVANQVGVMVTDNVVMGMGLHHHYLQDVCVCVCERVSVCVCVCVCV